MTLAHTLGRRWRRSGISTTGTSSSSSEPPYELFMGTAVDTVTGHTTLDLASGAVRYWVNSDPAVNADDAYDGTSHVWVSGSIGPKRTFKAGLALLTASGRAGQPDHLMVATGATFNFTLETLLMTGTRGASVAYPKAIRSYNPAAPTDEAQYGVGQFILMPVGTTQQVLMQVFNASYIFFQGVKVLGDQSVGLKWVNPNCRYIQYENVSFDGGCSINFDRQDQTTPTSAEDDSKRYGPFWVRHLAVGGNYFGPSSSYSPAIHSFGVVTGGLILDRCIVYRAGRPYTETRDWPQDPTRTQNIYLKNSPGMVLRGCVSTDAMLTGYQLRSDALIEYCVADTNPSNIQLGGDDSFWFNTPQGVASIARYNWITGTSWCNSSTLYERAYGIVNLLGRVRDSRQGVEIEDNIISNGRPIQGDPRYNTYPYFDNALTSTMDSRAVSDGITQAQWNAFTSVSRKKRNIVYNWAKPTLGTALVDYDNPGSAVPSFYDTSHTDDLIEGTYPALPSGCSSITGAAFVDPTRTMDSYAALFGQTRDQFWRAAILDPTNPRYHGYAITAYARAGFARI